MNNKEEIIKLRKQGVGYKAIARQLDLNLNSVKSFCRSQGLTSEVIKQKSRCKQCKKELIQIEKMKTRKFCCKECREYWWNHHRDEICPKVKLTIICKGCGKEFYAYEKANRKYCSHECFVNACFKGGFRHGQND